MIPAPTLTSSTLRWGQCRSGPPDVLPPIAVTPSVIVVSRKEAHKKYMRRWRLEQKTKRERICVSTFISALSGFGA